MTNKSPFTEAQIEDLEARAEARDQYRPRKSHFSFSEQAELDETAKNLQFNEIQTAELTRLFRKRLLPFIAYAILVLALALAFASVSRQEHKNHNAIVRLCEHQKQVSCKNI